LNYKLKVGDFVLPNGSLVEVGKQSAYDNTTSLETNLRVEFHRDISAPSEIELVLYFSLVGSGYILLNLSAGNVVDFEYISSITLKANDNTNLYHYPNGTEWGYLPFILPETPSNINISLSGSTQYSNEVAIGQGTGTSYIDTPYGSQDCIIFSVQNSPTAFGFDEEISPGSGKVRLDLGFNDYYIDADTNILLASQVGDPFWTIFEREFVLLGGSMILEETNIDLGPESILPALRTTVSWAPVLLLVLCVTGVGGFLLVRNQRRQQTKKRKDRQRRRRR
ncbi:MAG: hypothetical protein ACFFBD_30115, partial [Candidatus Hodarchaeota archaeon]